MSKLSQKLQQYLEFKKDYQDSILIYQVGDFYEMFWEDAIETAKILDLTLTSQKKKHRPMNVFAIRPDCSSFIPHIEPVEKENNNDIPLCGFPVYKVNTCLAKLVKAGQRVAVCDQVRNDAGNIIEHKIVRVVSGCPSLKKRSMKLL